MIPERAPGSAWTLRSVSRRSWMSLVVGLQMLVLVMIVGSQELNIALDSGAAVDLEVVHAYARKDPFRGAYVSGESALDLYGKTAELPAEPLRPGDKVLVVFAVEKGRRPRLARVERHRREAPPFSAASFSIPGTVRDESDRRLGAGDGALVARVGEPPVPIRLELPASIPLDASALPRFTGPSLVRASLHQGFLGHRYLSDVRLIGRGWSLDVSVAFDDARERLIVLSPRDAPGFEPGSLDAAPRSDVFVFDASGKEVSAVEVPARLIEGAVGRDGHLLALVSDRQYVQSEVSLAQIGDDGQIVQRSAPITLERILGFDGATGGVWMLVGPGPSRPQGPHFLERLSLAGAQGPRLGPFTSVPRSIVSLDDQAWVVETEQHRITHVDLASGRVLHEYRDLNNPTIVATAAGSLYVIEANRTQLTKLSGDGRVAWRLPRFQNLAWILPEPGTESGWVGAAGFDGTGGGVFRFASDGAISRASASGARPQWRDDWRRRRFGADTIRSAQGRLYVLENQSIALLDTTGATLTRIDGFRFASEQRLRR